MEHTSDDSEGSPRIDVRTLPESIAQLWETMLRLDPSWDISIWLDERAKEELQLIEGQLGREKLRLEQRLHRLETLAKRLKRQREVTEGVVWKDPHQRNLFDRIMKFTQQRLKYSRLSRRYWIDIYAVFLSQSRNQFAGNQ